ncbi:extracellular solute-binding protein [Bifidobacterium sp. ESL0704]|uniref:ABC transporter substrate-binding protein n=1 Tax=Bifidobacterium sp. ESL0704 TaxID=2983219 RepID=UPI0023F6E0C4|nr:extracellular solute-binding protein [Bifidobacterium sp. ESL0704]WEV52486.1 extracellular solute-binding protein [Bifidobacterium sp. ESL0704]
MKFRIMKKSIAFLGAVAMLSGLAACGSGSNKADESTNGKTEITVWAWEPTLKQVVPLFEKKNPNIKVKLQNVGTGTKHYTALDNALQAGSGAPDVSQIEYNMVPQYVIGKHLQDITSKVSGYDGFYTPGTWNAVHQGGKIYSLPMDSGPMAFFYDKEEFDKAGVDATQIKTWDDYYQAAKKLRAVGAYITSDSGDASMLETMSWLAGGRPFKLSADGSKIGINLTGDAGTKKFIDFWQKMISEDLIDTKTVAWSEDWFKGFVDGTIASQLTGAWMPANFANSAPAAAGKWRVLPMVTPDGSKVNAELGGSSLAVISTSKKADAAFKFIEFANHDREGIDARVDGGAFPSDVKTMKSSKFLNATTVKNSDGTPINYFGGEKYNAVLAEGAKLVHKGFQWTPFEVYTRAKFGDYMGKSFTQHQPLSTGLAAWQKNLKSYAKQQGFQVE